MAHRLRWAMSNGGVTAMLGGTVEIDETYVGGRKRGGTRGCPGRDSNKTPVVALAERGSGRVVAKPVYRVTADNLGKMLDQHVRHDATMMTDDFAAYKTLAEDSGRRHFSVKHQNEEWVNKDNRNVHSNTVEGFFSLLKRGINGTFHHVSREHLGRYCDEFAFRYERRKMSNGARAADIVFAAEGKESGVKRITVHGLRHTSATLLLAAGEQPHVVQRRLGDSKVEMTLNIYSHVLPTMQSNAASRIATVLHR